MRPSTIRRAVLLVCLSGAAVALVAAARTRRGTAPVSLTVRGNRATMLYHTPDSPYYDRIVTDARFACPADAEAAGFTGWNRRRRR
jgi:uncharacterized membrane protein ArfC